VCATARGRCPPRCGRRWCAAATQQPPQVALSRCESIAAVWGSGAAPAFTVPLQPTPAAFTATELSVCASAGHLPRDEAVRSQLPSRAPTSVRQASMPQSLRQPARPVPRGSLLCGKYRRRCSRAAAHETHRLVIFRCHRRTAQPRRHLRTSVRRTDTACPRPGPRGGLGALRGAGLGWARRPAALSRCCALLD
jgi:hypothetical protein